MPDTLSRRTFLAGSLAAAALAADGYLAPALGGAARGAGIAAELPTRGINIPGWADRADGVRPSGFVLQALREAGFASVRLPIEPESLLGKDCGRLLDAIDDTLADLNGWGFSVVLDMHPGDGLIDRFGREPEGAGRVVEAAWGAVAPVLAASPARFNWAELMNEPPLTAELWLPLRDRLAAAVRAVCPDHGLVWGAARYQSIGETMASPLLADDNAVVAVHYYSPISFTHQCADWSGPELAAMRGLPFPAGADHPRVAALRRELQRSGQRTALALLDEDFAADWDEARIEADFAGLAQWAAAKGCRVMVNEFGVLNACVDAASRTAWVGAVRRAAERNGIGWSYWELDQGFGFVRDRRHSGTMDAALVAALVG